MGERIPAIFLEDGSRHEADSCVPLAAALAAGAIRGAAWSRGQYPGTRLGRHQMPGLCSVGCWDAERAQDWCIPPHRNEGIELTTVLSGSVAFETGGIRETLVRGRVALTSPWQQHRLGCPAITPSRLVYIILDVGVRRPNGAWSWPDWVPGTAAEKAETGRRIVRNRQPVLAARTEMMFAFERIYELLTSSNPEADTAAMSLYVALAFTALGKALEGTAPGDGGLSETHLAVKLFLEGIEAHLDHPWRLEGMARQCGLSRSRFSQVCFELTNRSPVDYLNERRLIRAAALLAERGAGSITGVALACGFGSSQYFSRRFAQRFGCTPRDWQRRAPGKVA